MKPNMGWFERLLRVVVGGILLVSAAIDKPFVTEGAMVWVAGLLGLLLVGTGLTGYCWLYAYLDRMVESEEKPRKRQSSRRQAKPAKKSAKRASSSRKSPRRKKSRK